MLSKLILIFLRLLGNFFFQAKLPYYCQLNYHISFACTLCQVKILYFKEEIKKNREAEFDYDALLINCKETQFSLYKKSVLAFII